MGGVKGTVLVAGFATRHVAASAHRAGYIVYAVDHFCDLDLNWYAKDAIRFDELDEIPDAVATMIARHRVGMMVLTSGAESIDPPVPLIGTPREQAEQFLDKLETSRFFSGIGVRAPALLRDDEFPAFWKPRKASGGWRNAVIRSAGERDGWLAENEYMPAIAQEVVEGLAASVCCLTDGRRGCVVAANEQFLRGGSGQPYGFCGSMTPHPGPQAGEMAAVAAEIAARSGCLGTIGVDFVLGKWPMAIEVNPRFQGTLDTVEAATGINLFQAHLDACNGSLPDIPVQAGLYAAREILFAPRDMVVSTSLAHMAPAVADIPCKGTSIEKGHALVSVLGQGPTRAAACAMLENHKRQVLQYIG